MRTVYLRSRGCFLSRFSRFSHIFIAFIVIIVVLINAALIRRLPKLGLSVMSPRYDDCLLRILFRPVQGISVFIKVAFPIAARPWYRDNQRHRSRVNYARYRSRPWRAECRGSRKDMYYIHVHTRARVCAPERVGTRNLYKRKRRKDARRWRFDEEKEEEEASRSPPIVMRASLHVKSIDRGRMRDLEEIGATRDVQ